MSLQPGQSLCRYRYSPDAPAQRQFPLPAGMNKRREQLSSKTPLDYWIDPAGFSTLFDRPGLRLSGRSATKRDAKYRPVSRARNGDCAFANHVGRCQKSDIHSTASNAYADHMPHSDRSRQSIRVNQIPIAPHRNSRTRVSLLEKQVH